MHVYPLSLSVCCVCNYFVRIQEVYGEWGGTRSAVHVKWMGLQLGQVEEPWATVQEDYELSKERRA